METSPSSAADAVSELINGFWATQVIHAAVRLGLPEYLAQGAATAAELAVRADAHAPSLQRLLRALQTLGLCRPTGRDGAYELTESGQFLRADVGSSLRGRALFAGEMLWKQFADLTYVVKTGERTREVASGPEGFAQLASHPARLEAFQASMAEGSVRAARAAVEVYDFGRFARVLDLGGGFGGVLGVLLATYPEMRGAVCDLGYLERGACAYLARAGVAERAAFIAGDFFAAVPSSFDAIVMKYILHDWDDAHAQRILERCRAAVGPCAKLILLERVVPQSLGCGPADRDIMRADLTMLTVGGKERTRVEYQQLCALAGWRLTGVTAIETGFDLIEAVPC